MTRQQLESKTERRLSLRRRLDSRRYTRFFAGHCFAATRNPDLVSFWWKSRVAGDTNDRVPELTSRTLRDSKWYTHRDFLEVYREVTRVTLQRLARATGRIYQPPGVRTSSAPTDCWFVFASGERAQKLRESPCAMRLWEILRALLQPFACRSVSLVGGGPRLVSCTCVKIKVEPGSVLRCSFTDSEPTRKRPLWRVLVTLGYRGENLRQSVRADVCRAVRAYATTGQRRWVDDRRRRCATFCIVAERRIAMAIAASMRLIFHVETIATTPARLCSLASVFSTRRDASGTGRDFDLVRTLATAAYSQVLQDDNCLKKGLRVLRRWPTPCTPD